MAPVKPSPQFREWLADAVPTSGLSKREIARRMARTHPRGVSLDTIETHRRTLNKILSGDLTPTQPTRDLIADALERDDAPTEDDEDEDDLGKTLQLQLLLREQARVTRRLNKVLRAVSQ